MGGLRPDLSGELAALYERECEPMLRLAVLLVGSRSAAEDVVHDAFSSVGPRLAELDRPGAYLRTTVVNGCRSVLRRREVEDRAVRSLPRRDLVEAPDRLTELRLALDRLTPRQRTVIVLRYFVDLPDDEIADVLDCEPATVRSLAHRAMKVLREVLS